MIYLDVMAKAPLDTYAIESIKKGLSEYWYNPSSDNYNSKQVRQKIEEVRKIIAEDINCSPEEVVFTSGGSEGNSLAFNIDTRLKKLILRDPTSHHSVMAYDNAKTWNLKVDKKGVINISDLKKRLEIANTAVTSPILSIVSICGANNEIGTIQEIKKISRETRRYHNALLHVDAVQLYPYQKIDVKDLGIDIMSVSGSKLGCPSGVGFTYISKRISISPIIYGTQENSLRGGTENALYIIAMGEIIKNKLSQNRAVAQSKDFYLLANSFLRKVLAIDKKFYLVGKPLNDPNRLKCCLNICFTGYDAKSLLMFLDLNEIIASGGSACTSDTLEPSHVLKAVSVCDEDLHSCIRFSFTYECIACDSAVDNVVSTIKRFVEQNKKLQDKGVD